MRPLGWALVSLEQEEEMLEACIHGEKAMWGHSEISAMANQGERPQKKPTLPIL
jgi:hypothetical protein